MAKELWEEQHDERYRHHDLAAEDISIYDVLTVKGVAIRNFVETRESDGTRLTIEAFMGYLTSKGYRITKEKK